MSRNLMPKSGAMAPYVVVNRDAAVAGVFSVDGEVGAVVLTSKYLQISKYTTDKAATDAAINNINESIGNINTALGGVNTTLDTKAAKGANNDITELNALTKAIKISQGGTGAVTLENARANLQVERLRQQDNGTFITSPDGKYSLFIYNSGDFGLINSASTAVSAMKVAFGGTGGTTPKTARKGLNVPVGALAETVPDGDNVLNYVAVAGQSGYYSSGDAIVNGPPKQEGWWTYNFHCHGVDINGVAQYGILRAVGLSGSSWVNVLDGTDNWRGWQEQFNVQTTVQISNGGTGATNISQARSNFGIGETDIPVFRGVNLIEKNGANSGILYLINKNAEGVQLSYSRIYNEIQGATAKATIQVTREGGDYNYYQFDEHGNALNYNSITVGRGIGNALGDNSLVIGDTDTGFKWGGDGIIQIHCNGSNIASYEVHNMHINGLLTIWPTENNANGVRVSGARTGGGNALIGGQIAGGGWDGWRDRASGLLVELPGDDAASNIFKAVRWGGDWAAGLDVVRYGAGGCEAHLNIRGATYTFNDAGYASAVQWVNTSDIRLKANLKEIESAKEKVKSIKGYTYFKRNNLDEDEHSIYSEEAGVIAQDVQAVLPEAVYKISNSEYLGVSYSGITALLVNAFNELNEVVEKQQQEIDELKKLVKQLLGK
ncbi:tail fiber protein [Salmonella phage vB_SenS_UTK0010]|uniref:Tail fiber protein n=1 Tax=Salmonella phage vB_SenS_UTK0010 TaxID=3028909 RepID=A0AAE9ZG87_9CAUD|nr:tail fiber protein [Salmonella phage vB_SenS_UTK0010]